jgi:parallel beta-helix repeat protein
MTTIDNKDPGDVARGKINAAITKVSKDLTDFGAVYDGALVAGRWTGTDATVALQAAADWMATNKSSVEVSGPCVVANQVGKDLVAIECGTHFDLVFRGSGLIGHDFDPDEVISGNTQKNFVLFGTSDSFSDVEGITRELFRLTNPAIRGLWLDHPKERAQHVLFVTNYARVEIRNADIQNISGNTSVSDFNGSWQAIGGLYKNISSGAVRSKHTPNVIVNGCTFINVCDDTIDCHATDQTVLNTNFPVRAAITVVGCQFFQCKGIDLLSGTGVTITGNQLYRCIAGIAVWTSGDNTEGQGANHSVIIADNVILDPMRGIDYGVADDNNPIVPTAWATNDNSCILIGGADIATGTSSTQPEEWLPGSFEFVPPYSDTFTGLQAGAMWARDAISGTAGYASAAIKVTNNVIMRTLPEVTNVSDWGFDEGYPTKYGFMNIAVTAADFAPFGLSINSQMRGLLVSGNTFRNQPLMTAINMNSSDAVQMEYQQAEIVDNDFYDVLIGIGKSGTGTFRWDMRIRGNRFDMDPFWQNTNRANDGGWADPGATSDYNVGISLLNIIGTSVEDNTFRNCAIPFEAGTNWDRDNQFRGNQVFGFFDDEVWSTDNLGVAYVYHARADQILYREIELDPTDANYGGSVNTNEPLTFTGAQPTTGFYPRGYIVNRRNPSVSGGKILTGWIKILTNRAHVDGTDWEEMYVTNS